MKFRHDFSLVQATDNYRLYRCDDINARIDFVENNIIRVAIYRHRDEMLPTFCINPYGEPNSPARNRLDTDGFHFAQVSVDKTEHGEYIELESGIGVDVDFHNFLLSFYQEDEVLFEDRRPLAYNLENEFGRGYYHYISREEDEKIFGLGDKTGFMDKSGKNFKIETTDCMGYDAETSDPLYKHIPFYICENSVGNYGIFYDTSATCYMDFGKEINNYYPAFKSFKTDDNCIVYYAFFGTKLEILRSFARICGKQAFPPKWSFDYCASTMAYTDADNADEQMHGFLEKVKDMGLSCSGFYLSSGYTSIDGKRCVFNWNTDKFPDPQQFVKDFKDNNIHIIPNIKPAFLESHPMYKEIEKQGLFVKNPDGTPFVTQFWDGLGSYIDFTNPKGCDFWKKQVTEKLLDYGIDATWNDNNEFDIRDWDALANGFGFGKIKARNIRPNLTYLMVKSSYEAQRAKYPDKRPFLSTRSGNIAVRRLAQTWSGDNMTSWHDLYYGHYVGLTLSMSGMFFYGHDLGGFSGDMPSSELLLRWIQHGIFEPRFTIHSWNKDGTATMPWSYPEIENAVRDIFSQRKQLLPYLYSSAYNCVSYDEPMNAPLFLYYEDEDIEEDCESFLVGRDVLATCVLDEGIENITAYLPKGDDWYLGSKYYEGGQNVSLHIPPTSKMPYFVRSGCVFPTDEGEYGFNSEQKLVFTVYPLKSGFFQSSFFDDDGESFEYKKGNCVRLFFSVVCEEDKVTVFYKNIAKQKLVPDIRLLDGDDRKLIVQSRE